MITTQHLLSISAGAMVMAIALWLWTRWFRTPERARWLVDPLVVLTRDCPASVEEVQWAVDWWKRRGARFAWALSRRVDEVAHEEGTIVLTAGPRSGIVPERDPRERIRAERDPADRTVFARVVVTLPEVNYSLESGRRLLVHLLGHALGLRHVQRGDHVMATSARKRGWGDSGMVNAMAAVFGRSPSSLAVSTDHALARPPQDFGETDDTGPAQRRLRVDLSPRHPVVH